VAIPSVDPHARQGPIKRALLQVANTERGRWFGMNVAAKVDAKLMQRTNGRIALPAMMPVVVMTVRGAKSGQPRTTPLVYYTEGDDVILVASNFGREKHPAWLHNVRANPEITLSARGRSGRYRAREVEDRAERDRLFANFVKVFPGYGGYERRTDRDIRVMRCSPLPG
jgi:deazaflavin-dependent oxidoreductase (nitroreductase family)